MPDGLHLSVGPPYGVACHAYLRIITVTCVCGRRVCYKYIVYYLGFPLSACLSPVCCAGRNHHLRLYNLAALEGGDPESSALKVDGTRGMHCCCL